MPQHSPESAGANGAGEVQRLEGGRSPDGQFEVVNVSLHRTNNTGYRYQETYFEIREKSGQVIASEYSIKDLVFTTDDSSGDHVYDGADKVLWRSDSRFVAISTRTSKFAVHTEVFYKDGLTFKQVEMPDYSELDLKADPQAYDNTHVEPHRWRKNGDLVLDINFGYHTKYDGSIFEYFSTVHFTGHPPKASKGAETKQIEKVIPPS